MSDSRAQELKENFDKIWSRIVSVSKDCGRENSMPRLVAVSKTKPSSDIHQIYTQTGHKSFGENYVQELVDKSKELPSDIQWHFIGSLQSNKIKPVCSVPNLFVIETVDSAKKADLINKAIAQSARTTPLNIFIQVNTSGEESKSGIDPSAALELCKHVVANCPNVRLAGLMTIGSPDNSRSSETYNPDFEVLIQLRKSICEALGKQESEIELSMGMSDDFPLAVKMGSTNVRVGSSIFGARNYNK